MDRWLTAFTMLLAAGATAQRHPGYGPPENLGEAINSPAGEFEPEIAPDQVDLSAVPGLR